jgi:hypothetical protein
MDMLVESILSNTKKAYKESVLIDNSIIQDLLLSVLADCSRLADSIDKQELICNVESSDKRITRVRSTLSDDHSKDINIVAYVFSEYEHTSLFPNKSQTEAFEEASGLLNVKLTTFRNKRDAYDRYTSSARAGWDKPLSTQMKDIFNEYKILSKDIAIANARLILGKHNF